MLYSKGALIKGLDSLRAVLSFKRLLSISGTGQIENSKKKTKFFKNQNFGKHILNIKNLEVVCFRLRSIRKSKKKLIVKLYFVPKSFILKI